MPTNKYFLITIDVEDWFQVENFKRWIPFETWDQRELRVEKNVHHLLDLFDAITIPVKIHGPRTTYNGQTKKIEATFFVLGWLAKRFPSLVREICSRGHEIASHGLNHELCYRMSHDEIDKDVVASKKMLEDLLGESVFGYRAPSFSVDDGVLKNIEDAGYLYDSSYNSFSLHNRYGKLSLPENSDFISPIKISEKFYEIPISNIKVGTHHFPFGGGAYFRLIPYQIYRKGVEVILKNDGVHSLYLHPWEFDPDQPRVDEASFQYKFRHYTNLKYTNKKLTKLINRFSECNFTTCQKFIEQKAILNVYF